MAIVKDKNSLLAALQGQLGKQYVVKQYKNKVVFTIYPNMAKVRRSKKQKNEQSRFQQAVVYAQWVLANPEKKKLYAKRIKKGQTVYHAAISDFMKGTIIS